jgi:hypothetical protein
MTGTLLWSSAHFHGSGKFQLGAASAGFAG